MATLSIGQKSASLLRLLRGMSNRRAVRALLPFGFTQETLDEGWALLKAGATSRLDMRTQVPAAGNLLVEEIDAWENMWFPIIKTVLRTRYPAVHDVVFRNLNQTSGPDVILGVHALITRLDGLVDGSDEEQDALETLSRFGIDEDVLAEARDRVAEASQMAAEPLPPVDLEAERVEREAAEKAMWDFYLVWSAIARAAIRDGRLLREMGFSRSSGSSRGAGGAGGSFGDGDGEAVLPEGDEIGGGAVD